MASILPQTAPAPNSTTTTVLDLATVTCPIDRARRVTGIARANGTLTPQLAALRRAALIEASGARSLSLTELARRVGLTPGRICQLVGARRSQSGVAA
jgi:N-acetylglutamate synthase/N-acetylornithine aminotransferase